MGSNSQTGTCWNRVATSSAESGKLHAKFWLTGRYISASIEICQQLLSKKSTEQVAKYADMLSAMGTEPRLRIMQLLLSAHPDGLVVGDIQSELDIPNSTLSHHLDKLKNEELVNVRRESTFLAIHGQYGSTPGTAAVPLRRMLHSK